MQIVSVEKPDLPAFPVSDRFKFQIVYFMTPAGEPGVPPLGHGEYWIRLEDARRWLDEGGVAVVSPLDAASKAELELTEEQEAWLEWMVAGEIQHVRLVAE